MAVALREPPPFLLELDRLDSEPAPAQPDGVRALRREAAARFRAEGLPDPRDEDWRHTLLTPLSQTAYRRAARGPADLAAAAELAAEHRIPGSFELVFVNGRHVPELSAGGPARGVTAIGVAEALGGAATDPSLGAALAELGRQADLDHPFVALNTAFLADGALVVVAPGAVLEAPIHLLFLALEQAGPTAAYPRSLIVAGAGSQATVVETYTGLGETFTCGVTEIVTGANAVLEHIKLQRESVAGVHMGSEHVRLERDSVFSSHSISTGGRLVRHDVVARLAGEGAECTLNGLYVVAGTQFVDNHMRVEHVAAHCASHELYKGILDDEARAVFNGRIYVHPGAQKTDAKQSNRNLLRARGRS